MKVQQSINAGFNDSLLISRGSSQNWPHHVAWVVALSHFHAIASHYAPYSIKNTCPLFCRCLCLTAKKPSTSTFSWNSFGITVSKISCKWSGIMMPPSLEQNAWRRCWRFSRTRPRWKCWNNTTETSRNWMLLIDFFWRLCLCLSKCFRKQSRMFSLGRASCIRARRPKIKANYYNSGLDQGKGNHVFLVTSLMNHD